MSTDIDLFGEREEEDPTSKLPDLDTPYDYRPDLSALGLLEHERGIVEDTADNRRALRAAGLQWDTVYDQLGRPTGLIAGRSQEALKERRLQSLSEKRALLTDPTKNNSDFLTGLDLLVDEAACKVTPPWVLGATRLFVDEENGKVSKSKNRAPSSLPHRCRIVKTDGIRCMLWSSGRPKDDGLCRIHLRTNRRPGADVEWARQKLKQSASAAVDVLEELMDNAQSEPVRLKASTEILDRAGVRGGVEVDVGGQIEVRPAKDIVAERLQRLADAAQRRAASLPDAKVIEAEVVVEDSINSNGEEPTDGTK
jgi:hypothetical protein